MAYPILKTFCYNALIQIFNTVSQLMNSMVSIGVLELITAQRYFECVRKSVRVKHLF